MPLREEIPGDEQTAPLPGSRSSEAPAVSGRAHMGFWYYRALVFNFARRDLRARYKGTLLGFAWSLVVPIATLVTYSLVFGTIFKGDPPTFGNGHHGVFFVFLFSGLAPWGMYATTLGISIASLVGIGPLMKKIYFPAYASVFGSVLAIFYQSLIEFLTLFVILIVLGNLGPTWLLLFAWLALFAVFVAALSLMLSVLNVYMRDTAYLVGIVLQMQFYLTPIIYPLSVVPGVRYHIPLRSIIQYQPLAVYVEVFRSLVYDLDPGRATAWSVAVFYSVLAVGGARLVYKRWGQDLSEEL